MKGTRRLIVALLLALVMSFALVGCQPEDTGGGNLLLPELPKLDLPDDTLPPITQNITLPVVAPETAPQAGNGETAPVIGEISASTDAYVIDENEVSYPATGKELTAWQYVFVEVDGFHADYANIKLDVVANGAKYLTVAAVYYEQYAESEADEAGFPVVSLLVESLSEGSQTFIIGFGETRIINKNYDAVSGKFLKDYTVMGLIFLIDSNPVQSKADGAGTLTFDNISFHKDNDPAIQKPAKTPKVLNNWTTTGPLNASETAEGGVATISYNSAPGWNTATVRVSDYSKAYGKIAITLDISDLDSLGIALNYGGGNTVIKSNNDPLLTGVVTGTTQDVVDNEDGSHTFTFDIQTMPVGDELLIQQSINSIMFYFDATTASITTTRTIEFFAIEFIKTGEDELASNLVEVTANWACDIVGYPDYNGTATLTDMVAGGFCKFTYDYALAWQPLKVGVKNFINSAVKSLSFTVKLNGVEGVGIGFADGFAWNATNTEVRWMDASIAAGTVYETTIVDNLDGSKTFTIDISSYFDGSGWINIEHDVNAIWFKFSGSAEVVGTASVEFMGIEVVQEGGSAPAPATATANWESDAEVAITISNKVEGGACLIEYNGTSAWRSARLRINGFHDGITSVTFTIKASALELMSVSLAESQLWNSPTMQLLWMEAPLVSSDYYGTTVVNNSDGSVTVAIDFSGKTIETSGGVEFDVGAIWFDFDYAKVITEARTLEFFEVVFA